MVVNLPSNTASSTSSWYIANIRHTGWYRVNYDQDNWRLLINQLLKNHTLIHPIHRAQLLDDSFYLAQTEDVNRTLWFDLTKYLANETDPLPLDSALDHFITLDNKIQEDYETHQLYKVTFNFFFNF